MSNFGDLSSSNGLKSLNDFLASASYIKGFSASKADLDVYVNVNANVDASAYPHVSRWYSHISALKSLGVLRGTGTVVEVQQEVKQEAKQETPKEEPKKEAAKEEAGGDDDFSLDDEDDGAAAAIIAKKKKEEEEKSKKKAKEAPVAKSTLILDVKPDSSETDMAALEAAVRKIQQDGLRWAGSELIPVAYGIKKLRIIAVIVDDLVSVDDLQEEIQKIPDCQSTDIYAFNKV